MNTIYKNGKTIYILWDIALVLTIWSFSLWLSNYSYNENRALADEDWLTAHTLISMRALDNWGFFHLFGASTYIPYSYEFQGADLTTFTYAEGIYLSYPSLWLIFPYITFKLFGLFISNYELTPAFIIIYNLIVNRLVCGLIVYFIFRYLLNSFFHNFLFYKQLGSLGQRLLAIIGLSGWMLPASALINTQTLYFSDQAVVLPVYCLFLFSLKNKFIFWNIRWPDRLILVVLSLLSVGMDWYGLVFVAVLFGCVTIITYSNHRDKTSQTILSKIVKNVVIPLATGTTISLAFFICQLIYFKDGFRQIARTFFYRIGSSGVVLTSPVDFYSYLVNHWKAYLPVLYRFVILGLQKVSHIPGSVIILVFVLFFVFVPVLIWLFISSSARNLNNLGSLSLLYLAPCIQILLLRQHSHIHGFSAFKMALPISFSTCILPVIFILYLVCLLNWTSRSFRRTTFIILFSIYLLPFMLKFPSKDYIGFSSNSKSVYKDLGILIHHEIPKNAIIFSHNLVTSKEGLGQKGDASLWYSDRYLYTTKEFASIKHKLEKRLIDEAKFIFIDYEDSVHKNNIEPDIMNACEDKWFKYTSLVEERIVVGCSSRELNLTLKK